MRRCGKSENGVADAAAMMNGDVRATLVADVEKESSFIRFPEFSATKVAPVRYRGRPEKKEARRRVCPGLFTKPFLLYEATI